MGNDALTLAVTIGNCRLSNTIIETDDVLTADTVIEASQMFFEELNYLSLLVERLNSLSITEPMEFCDYIQSILSLRHRSWAVSISFGEAYELACEDGDVEVSNLENILTKIYEKLSYIDDLILCKKQLFLIETEFFNNSRKILAAPYNDPLPWWLNGCLEVSKNVEDPKSHHESTVL